MPSFTKTENLLKFSLKVQKISDRESNAKAGKMLRPSLFLVSSYGPEPG